MWESDNAWLYVSINGLHFSWALAGTLFIDCFSERMPSALAILHGLLYQPWFKPPLKACSPTKA